MRILRNFNSSRIARGVVVADEVEAGFDNEAYLHRVLGLITRARQSLAAEDAGRRQPFATADS